MQKRNHVHVLKVKMELIYPDWVLRCSTYDIKLIIMDHPTKINVSESKRFLFGVYLTCHNL